jgi:hypothetical protein
VLHARGAGVKACADSVAATSRRTIDTQHTAVSTWYPGNADAHLFQSIIGLAYPTNIVPRGVAVLLSAPRPDGCESATVQVYPTARSCSAVQADLSKTAKGSADLSGTPIFESDTGSRNLLIPTAGNGCVLVTVGMTFAPDPPAAAPPVPPGADAPRPAPPSAGPTPSSGPPASTPAPASPPAK